HAGEPHRPGAMRNASPVARPCRAWRATPGTVIKENLMNEPNDPRTLGRGSYVLDDGASADTLINDAMEWLSHADSLQALLAEYMVDASLPDRALMVRAVATLSLLTRMTSQSLHQANIRRIWDEAVALGGAK
ncbi:hypothetical protein KCV01_g17005, partial [Aureobasidium melanogenum]